MINPVGSRKQYIRHVSYDRKTGEQLSESYEPYDLKPEISEAESTDMLLRAVVGDVDSYVQKMLKDFEMQGGERTSRDVAHHVKGA